MSLSLEKQHSKSKQLNLNQSLKEAKASFQSQTSDPEILFTRYNWSN